MSNIITDTKQQALPPHGEGWEGGSFLRDVASDLLKRFGNNLSQVTVVFPGKRARLFMNQYLPQLSERPVWAPQYKTIDELYLQLSPYRKADQIPTICLLYDIYAHLVPDAEPLDEFYSWGEIILSDFDDIDKHLAPADKIFHNVYDLQSISTNYITPEQEAALRDFFKNFSVEANTAIKERFLRLWNIMPQLYTRLKEELKKNGQLYSGALYREVAEHTLQSPKGGDSADECRHTQEISPLRGQGGLGLYCFVGFNVLDESEETLFRYYQEEHQALFYWDYDELYIHDAQWEAGLFIAHNLRMFPNALDVNHFDNLRHLKDITFIATSTNNAQSRYVPEWIAEHLTDRENETAVILGDEHALGSVLHSIPEQTPRLINVTMGFPLVDTPVYSFLNVLMAMYIDGYDATAQAFCYTFLEKVKRHPYYPIIEQNEEVRNQLFAPIDQKGAPSPLVEGWGEATLPRLILACDTLAQHFSSVKDDIYHQLYTEALFQCHLIFTQFQSLCLRITGATLRRLMYQVLSSTSIPFHGEPAVGMQVMGLLESRNLDFRHILMLGVNEGILPKKSDEASLIPYSLRETFGLTTIRHRISVFAYYFYRIIARAEHLTLMYNENSSGGTTNEMSRFMRQMMAETDLPIRFVRLMPENNLASTNPPLEVVKTKEMVEELRTKYINNPKNSLSPTAINTYLSCSLKFYYKYIAKIPEKELLEDGITPIVMGIVFHDAAELFYLHLTHHYQTKTITRAMLEKVMENPSVLLHPFINISLILNYFSPVDDETKKDDYLRRYAQLSQQELLERTGRFFAQPANAHLLVGLNHIIHNVLCRYLEQLVRYDILHTPFLLEAIEQDRYFSLEVAPGEFIRTGGRIDRLESHCDAAGDERFVVVDYKTGGSVSPVKDIETIFVHKNKQDGYFLQTFIYALAVQQTDHIESVQPTLFYVNRAGNAATYDRALYLGTATHKEPVQTISAVREPFIEQLTRTVQQIFAEGDTMHATDNTVACQYCDFRQICGR